MTYERITRTAIALALALMAACANLEQPTARNASTLVIHSVLNMRQQNGAVLVYRARTGSTTTAGSGIGDDEPVSDATVTITAPNGAVMVAEHTAPDTSYALMPGVYAFTTVDYAGVHFADGGTYALRVQTRGGEEVTGTTTIPQGPALMASAPVRVFSRLRDTLSLVWPRVPGARSYEVAVGLADAGEIWYRIFTDTSIVLPGNALTITGDRVFSIGPVDVVVSAVDANYYDYYRARSDPLAGAAPGHLNGAVGVFGSVAPILSQRLQVR